MQKTMHVDLLMLSEGQKPKIEGPGFLKWKKAWVRVDLEVRGKLVDASGSIPGLPGSTLEPDIFRDTKNKSQVNAYTLKPAHTHTVSCADRDDATNIVLADLHFVSDDTSSQQAQCQWAQLSFRAPKDNPERSWKLRPGGKLSKMTSTYPYEKWMASCPAVKYLTPAEFCFPGTHDTGAYQKPDFTPVCAKDGIAHSDLRFTPAFQTIATRWTVSQPGCSLYTQLMNGVRSLDLRVAFSYDKEPQLYLIHTFAVCKLEDAMDDIKKFVTSHPTELILMTVLPYYQIVDSNLQRIIEAHLGPFMLPNKHGNDRFDKSQTVQAILASGYRIVARYRHQAGQSTTSKLWFSFSNMAYVIPFKSLDTVPKKQKALLTNLKKYESDTANHWKMFDLSYTLTEVTIDIAESIFTGETLATLADKMNVTLMDFVYHKLDSRLRQLINIISVDDEVHSKVVAACIFMNHERINGHASLSSLPPSGQSQPIKKSHGRPLTRRKSCWRKLRELCCCCCCGGEDSSDDSEEKARLNDTQLESPDVW